MKGRERAQKILAPAFVVAVQQVRNARPYASEGAHEKTAHAQRRVLRARNDDALKYVAQRYRDDEQSARGGGEVLSAYGAGLALAVGVGVSAGIGVAGPGVGEGVAGGGAVGPPVSGMMRK